MCSKAIHSADTGCRHKETQFRSLLGVPHSHCALRCESCKNNHIYSFVIKGFFIIHEHRGGKWRFVHVQLLNNFLNYSILLKQLEDQANLLSDGKDLHYLYVLKVFLFPKT